MHVVQGVLKIPMVKRGHRFVYLRTRQEKLCVGSMRLPLILRENLIRISVDATSIQLPLEFKPVSFRYASHFPIPYSTDATIVTLNGSVELQEFVEDDTVDIEVRVPTDCQAHLLSLLAAGHFVCQQSLPFNREYQGDGWQILPKSPC